MISFSVLEANKRLPLIRHITKDIVTSWSQIVTFRTEMEMKQKAGKDVTDDKEQLNKLIDKLNVYISEIEELGCFIEEFRRGVILFPTLFKGRKVFLCWCDQDQEVSYWHEIDETFKDRVKIRDVRDFYKRDV